MNYFAPKWWLYVMIWLPRTTDNLTFCPSPLKFEVLRVDYMLFLGFKLHKGNSTWEKLV